MSRNWWPAPLLLGALALLTNAGCMSPRLTVSPVPTSSAPPASEAAAGSTAPSPSPPARPSPSRPGTRSTTAGMPRSGPGTFRYAATAGRVLGRSGPLRRFRVGVESNLTTVDPAQFAAMVDQVLGDRRSWTAGGQVRFQRVPPGSPYDFTINLATSGTTRNMCTAGGVDATMGYTSCRVPGHVVLNLDRWLTSVPYYARAGQPLDTYRTYMINHEVGHELGYGHELCPAHGRPAPVMEQQTLGLHGCTPNPWPYLNGSRYSGPPGTY